MTTKTGYKLFRQDKDGNLHPLYVLSKDIILVGEWVLAKDNPPMTDKGKVKGKMELHFRPGFHIAGLRPYAPQITKVDGCVWCKVEYCADIDYNEEAQKNGTNKEGKIIPIKSELDRLPYMGYYYFKTSWKQEEPWIICDRIKVTEILSWEEVDRLNKEFLERKVS